MRQSWVDGGVAWHGVGNEVEWSGAEWIAVME